MKMKTLLAALVALSLATAVKAESIALWDSYNAAKVESKAALADLEAGNTTTAALERAWTAFAATSTTAAALDGREDIVAWQLNNVAFAGITWFKHAGYTARMAALEAQPAGPDKPAAIRQAKDDLLPLFNTIVVKAKEALAAARATGYSEESFNRVVASNQEFLKWGEWFLNN